ncbi:MAG TPA: hypothetical protein ENK57_01995 [Polyangiaceae bacterium]|nr:hypothetical protein [Polyangiaceae bacterium]
MTTRRLEHRFPSASARSRSDLPSGAELRSMVLIVGALFAAGCAPTPVEVDITFPREENFLFTEFGQLLVYEVDPLTGLGDCPSLLRQAETNMGSPVLMTERLPICDFRAGGVGFGDVPPGPHAYLLLATDDADNLLLDGCTIAEAYEGAPPVEIRLFPTADYNDAVARRTLSCASANDKCESGCR